MLVDRSADPEVSVLMVLWNAAPFLDRCLAPLVDDARPIEVLCIDNASADESADRASDLGCQVERSGVNLGFPAAINKLISRCRAPITLLLNPDVELAPDTLSRCLEALTQPGVGMVGANLRRPDGRADPPAARRFRSLTTILLESTGLASLWRRLDVQYLPTWDRTTSRDVPCINGAFMLLPTDTLRAVGGLDERVFLYLEDQELCRAVAARGERIRFVADAVAMHVGGGSTEASRPDQRTAAYLHRLDASIEIVRRREGSPQAIAALLILVARCLVLWAIATATRNPAGRQKYRAAVRWLVEQRGGRRPPPPVP